MVKACNDFTRARAWFKAIDPKPLAWRPHTPKARSGKSDERQRPVTLLDSPKTENSFAAARKAMIDSQLRTSGVTARDVVSRMGAVPREDFVPESARSVAYMDRALPLAGGGFIAAPLVQGMMLAEAAPKAGEHAIVVDGGSGYLAELLGPLVGSVEMLTAEQALAPRRGGKKADLILIEGAIENVPDALAKRLADDGRLVTGLAGTGVTRLARGRKTPNGVALMPFADVGIPRLTAFDKPKGWSF